MAVAAAPDHASAQALFQKGVAAHTKGEIAAATDFYRKAIAYDPGLAEAWNNLATGHAQLGDDESALTCLRRALDVKPEYAEAQSNLGIFLAERGRHEEAIPHLERAVALNAGNDSWFNNLGNAYVEFLRYADALAAYDRGIALNPDNVDCWSNRGLALRGLRRPGDAIASIERALRLAPSHVNSLCNLGIVLKEEKRMPEAVSAMRKATDIDPANPALWVNFASVYEAMGEFGKMRDTAMRAAEIDPEFVEAHNLLANCELEAGRHDEAEALYKRVVAADPTNRNANWNLALLWLMRGDFARGWKQFEWRKQLHSVVLDRHDYGQPEWAGDALDGRDILLHSEQGIGDAIQFVRFAAQVKAKGARRVYLECPYPVVPLLSGVKGIDAVVARGAPLPAFDVHSSLLSLPGLLGTTLETLPAPVPYIPVEPRPAWSSVLAPRNRLKIGIVWAGNPAHARDHIRSVPLAAFQSLFGVDGTHFFSLQKGAVAEQQLAALPAGSITNLAVELQDFRDTASVLEALDLVITVDTSVAHLAGALGRPTWVLLPHVCDFRWMLDRRDSPWYPTMRLFRQPAPGDWDTVFADVACALREVAAGKAEPEGSTQGPAGGISITATAATPVEETIVTLNSASFLADGRHRFDLWFPLELLSDASAFAQYEGELLHGGHDMPLRHFLDELLQGTDALVDIAPGLGLATLSAASAPNPPAHIAIVERNAASARRIAQLVSRRAPALSFSAGASLDAAFDAASRCTRSVVRVGDATLTDAVADGVGRLAGDRRPAAIIWTSLVPAAHEATLLFLRSLGYVLAALSLIDGEPSLDAIEDATREQAMVALLPALLDELTAPAAEAPAAISPPQAALLSPAMPVATPSTSAEARVPDVRPSVGIDWELRYDTGWGTYGTNLALELLKGGAVEPAIFAASAAELPVLSRTLLEGVLHHAATRAERLRQSPHAPVHFPGLMLRALGNNFVHGPMWDRVNAPRNAGVIFFEDTTFDAAALERARALDLVVTGSHWNERVLRARGLINVATVLQGIDPAVFHPAPRSGHFGDRFVVFSGGKLEYRKGQDLVAAAFRIFHQRHPEALLVVAWHNNWPGLIADLDLAGHVRGTPELRGSSLAVSAWLAANGIPANACVDVGHQPNALMGQVMRECDVALFPNRCEGGTNLVAMECMAAGVPTIVSANTGHLDLVATGGCLALERQRAVHAPTRFFRGVEGWGESDVEEMVQALEFAFTQRAAMAVLADRGATAMAAQSWRHQTQQLLHVLQPLL